MTREWIVKNRMAVFMAAAALLHMAAFVWIRFALPAAQAAEKEGNEVFKLVDVDEYVPPPPPPEAAVVNVYNQPTASETVIETEDIVFETTEEVAYIPEIEYLPQHKISEIPDIPTKEILSRIEYPPIAMKQGIQGVVYLELFIDEKGAIRKVEVLKDPGFGFAEAAIKAIAGLTCKPAYANGKAVAVRFRYPVRFSLK